MGGCFTLKNLCAMKGAKAFILLMLGLYACLLTLDYLKAFVFPVQHHGILIWSKTAVLVAGGILIMRLTLETRTFRLFIVCYLGLWIGYYVLKTVVSKFGGEANENSVNLNNVLVVYLNVTQLITPFPFFLFWVINRVIKRVISNE